MTFPLFSPSAVAGALVVLACGAAHAQPAPPTSACTDSLVVAEQRYADQVYVDVEPLVRDCISDASITPATARRAYRLLARAYIKQSMMAEAQQAVVDLLDTDPSYTADPGADLPSYVAVVEAARAQVRAAPDSPSPPTIGAPPAASAPPPVPRPSAPTLSEASGADEVAGEADTDGAPPDLVDVNTADEEALDAVPGIGPALAARIVAYREQNGAFRSAAELENVRGIGPRSIAQMLPYLTAGGPLAAPVASSAEPAGAGQPPVNINTATAEELEALPGIGPALAERIIEFRASYGLFRDLNDVLLVRGIGTRKLEQIAPLVTVR